MKKEIESHNLRPFNRPGEVPVPIGERNVTWMVYDHAFGLQSTKTVAGKVEMLLNAVPSDRFYLAWTGQYSTDIFSVTFKELKAATKDWKCWDEVRKEQRLVKLQRLQTKAEK